MSGPEFRTVDAGELNLRVAVQGTGPLVLFVHGFPESWYSWRHQLGPVAEAGFTAAAIDVRGYGGSDKPQPVEAYSLPHMVSDIVGAAEALSPGERFIVVGHDWGAPMVWNSALTRPDRVRAVAALSVPFLGIGERNFRDIFDELFTAKGRFFYQAYFQQEGVAEAELEPDVEAFLRRFLYAISGDAPDGTWPSDKTTADPLLKGLPDPQPFPAWLTAEDLAYYRREFEGSGLRGPINKYRTHALDHAWQQPWKGKTIDQPALFIAGDRDLAFNMFRGPDPIEIMRKLVPNLEAHVLPGCGHWTQQERPEEVNALLVPWLKRQQP